MSRRDIPQNQRFEGERSRPPYRFVDSKPMQYPATLGIVLVACLLQLAFWSYLQPLIFFFFYPALFLVSWLVDTKPAVLATVFAVFLSWYFFVEPHHSFSGVPLRAGIQIALFSGMGVLFTAFHAKLRGSQKRLWDLASDELRYKNQLMLEIADNTASCLFLHDEKGFVTYMNPAAEAATGFKIEELREKPLHDYIHHHRPDGSPYPMKECPVGKVYSEGVTIKEAEDVFIRKDGSFFPVSYSVAPLKANGKILGSVLEFRDITAQKKAQQERAASEKRLKLVVENAPIAIAMFDTEMRYLLVSQQWIRDYKLGGWDFIGKSHYDIFPEISDEWKKIHRRGLAGEVLGSEADRFVRLDGSTQWVCWEVRPWHRDDGSIGGILIATQDITKQRETELELKKTLEDLKAREAEFSSLGDTIDQLAWMTDPDGWIYWYNKRWYEYTGTTLEEMKGWGWQRVHHPDHVERVVNFVEKAWKKGEPWELIFPLRSKRGEWRWFLTRGIPMRDDQGKLVRWVGTNTDIHDQKLTEEELIRSNAELARFAFIASHDLKEPIRTVSNYVQLLAVKYRGKLDESADTYINFITQAVDRMYALINDLLSYSRIGAQAPERKVVNARQLVDHALTNLAESIKESGAEIAVGPLPEVMADPSQSLQLFQNLIGNAIKYRDPQRAPQISIEAKRKEGEWIFAISDNGIGIEREYFEKIFVLFQRLHNKDEYSGTGIGLAVCKKIVEQHGGRIWVESQVGKGSTFYFAVPDAQSLRKREAGSTE